MAIDDGLLSEIVRRLLAVAALERIILFGSAATGQMTPDSDIDLLVVERSPGDPRTEAVRLRGALRGLGRPFDVIVLSADQFEESRNGIGGIAYPATKYGKAIYEAA